jgi:hypothetical protein
MPAVQLRKDVPHPVGALLAAPDFREGTLVVVRLRLQEAVQVIRVVCMATSACVGHVRHPPHRRRRSFARLLSRGRATHSSSLHGGILPPAPRPAPQSIRFFLPCSAAHTAKGPSPKSQANASLAVRHSVNRRGCGFVLPSAGELTTGARRADRAVHSFLPHSNHPPPASVNRHRPASGFPRPPPSATRRGSLPRETCTYPRSGPLRGSFGACQKSSSPSFQGFRWTAGWIA